MIQTSDKKKKLIFIIAMALLLVIQLGVLIYFGNRKAGFHEDELYTYYSTNKSAGLFVNDRQWMVRDDLRNDFVVLEGEQFRYNVVKQMQSWDVHPPLYYYIFHTVCSLFPGVFSKWLGISVNLIAFVGSFMVLAWVAYMASQGLKKEALQETDRDSAIDRGRILAFLTCFGWGFSAAVISGVMFIRMYQWLTLFVLLCLALHLRAIQKQDFKLRSFLLPLGITVFLGFLTQYYYIIFHFFLGAGFCFYLLHKKKIKELLSYGCCCAVSLMAAILYYPASLSHIFRGYRGTEAVGEFTDASNTFGRLRFFLGLFDDYVMNDTLIIWLWVIVLLAVTLSNLNKRKKSGNSEWNVSIGLMLFAAAGYFFTISKTALLLGETSNRYQLPIYGIWIFLLIYFVWSKIQMITESVKRFSDSPKAKKMLNSILAAALLFVLLVTEGFALKDGKVFFLYEEEKEVMEFVKNNTDKPVVVFYNETSADNIWWLSDELMEYPQVYLASQGNQEKITDKTLTQSDSLLAYVADHEDKKSCLERLLNENEKLSSYHVIAHKGLWTLYEIQ